MNNKSIIWILVVVVALGALFAWPAFSNPERSRIKEWNQAEVDCLPSHARAALHIHPALSITVNGTPEAIPQNTGIVRGCMAELHIHGEDNVIHAESVLATKEFTLGQFLLVHEKPLMREGYSVKMMVDGVESSAGESLVLQDKQQIVVEYTKQ